MTFSNIILWALQWFLGGWFVLSTVAVLPFLLSGRLDARRVPGLGDLPRPLLIFVGAAHIAGGIGVLLPQLLDHLPWLTPVAALALAIQCLMGGGFHLRAAEDALEPSLWGLLCGAVFVGRFHLLSSAPELPHGTLTWVIIILFIGLLINMAVLLRGSQNPLRHSDSHQNRETDVPTATTPPEGT